MSSKLLVDHSECTLFWKNNLFERDMKYRKLNFLRFLEDTQCASNSYRQILMNCTLSENTHFKQKMCVQKWCFSKVEDTVSSLNSCAAKCYFSLIFWTIYIFRKINVTSESLYSNTYLKTWVRKKYVHHRNDLNN